MSSSQPLAATLVQLPAGTTTVKNRPLSNGFSGGAAYVLIPTVLKNTFSTNSIFSIQNTDTVAADILVRFVPVSGTPIDVNIANLPPGAAKYFDLGTMTALPSTFNGSVQVFAQDDGGAAGSGSVVATAMELATNSDNVYAFEGAAETGNIVYMPSAFCKFGAGGAINSAYAVQNTSDSADASVTVTYSNGSVDGPYTIAPGQKKSFPGCGVDTANPVNPVGFIGSATISSVGAPIVGIAKIYGNGLSTAFLGFVSGADKVALPYVRWTEVKWVVGGYQRANIAIQNVGTSELPAGSVSVKYYDKDGVLVGTHTIATAIPVGGKVNSNPLAIGATEFGYTGTSIGGGAIVEGPAGSQLAVITRIESRITTGTVGEDYSGIAVLP